MTAITGSVGVATAALIKETRTARHVDRMLRTSVALTTEEFIDKKLETRVDALEEALIAIGKERLTLNGRTSFRCHPEYRWVCVTPLEV